MRHVPVLLNETISALQLEPGMNVVDCTLGDGGHAEAVLNQTTPNGQLMGFDLDRESLLRAKKYLHNFEDRIIFVRDNFENLQKNIEAEKFEQIKGIIMDLGWSSPQFEERRRGFTFQKKDEPLDMRYDTLLNCRHNSPNPPLGVDGKPLYGRCTAAEHLNLKSADELARMFKEYGEEKFAKDIAKLIVERRVGDPLETTGDLVDIILEVYRKKLKTDKEVPWVGGIHPATKVFQALRIAVNDELGVLQKALPQAVDALASGGRLAIISFHSLEDGIVKHFFKKNTGNKIKIITKKPIIASDSEMEQNPRARSAKLRVVEKK